jgi:hypothetical protein
MGAYPDLPLSSFVVISCGLSAGIDNRKDEDEMDGTPLRYLTTTCTTDSDGYAQMSFQ